jgi:hypothetical protein
MIGLRGDPVLWWFVAGVLLLVVLVLAWWFRRPGDQPAVLPASDPTVASAAAFAAAFARDYLSWDEGDPPRRAAALRAYLEDPEMGAELGWDGRGCRSADIALPGLVDVRDHPALVVVDVRVRYTPFERVDHIDSDHPHSDTTPFTNTLDGAGLAAAAPSPTTRGWRALPARWTRLAVPVRHAEGRLLIELEYVHD